MLTGLLRCGKCGHAMTGKMKKGRNDKKWGQYECARRVGFRDCSQPTMFATRLEPQVKARVMVLLERVRMAEVRQRAKDLAPKVLNEGMREQQEKWKLFSSKKEQLEGRLANLEDTLLDGLIDPGRYVKRRDEILGDLREAEQQLSAFPKLAPPDLDPVFSILDNTTWEDLDSDAWRDIMELLVDRVLLTEREVGIQWKPICRPLLLLDETEDSTFLTLGEVMMVGAP